MQEGGMKKQTFNIPKVYKEIILKHQIINSYSENYH